MTYFTRGRTSRSVAVMFSLVNGLEVVLRLLVGRIRRVNAHDINLDFGGVEGLILGGIGEVGGVVLCAGGFSESEHGLSWGVLR